MTGDGNRYAMGSIGTQLSIAVELTDVYTDGRPVGPICVSLVDRTETFRQLPSGYHVLSDLPVDVESVRLAVDASVYLPKERSVTLEDLDDLHPVESIELLPAPNYDFGGGVTLVRGHISDAGEPVSGASVTIDGRDEETRCDHRGEYVLWFDNLGPDDVRTSEDGKRFVEVDGDALQIRAEKLDGTTATESAEVELGTTASATITF